jgi:hypothetical protein
MRQPEMVQRHDNPDVERVKKTLAGITIPEANLKQVAADCAITFWISAVQDNESQHRGVSTIYQGGTDPQPIVDIVATNVSALALLNDICRQANLGWWLTPKCLMIRPRNDIGAEPGVGR